MGVWLRAGILYTKGIKTADLVSSKQYLPKSAAQN